MERSKYRMEVGWGFGRVRIRCFRLLVHGRVGVIARTLQPKCPKGFPAMHLPIPHFFSYLRRSPVTMLSWLTMPEVAAIKE